MNPQIPLELLVSYGATFKEYQKGELVFSETEYPNYYFQVVSGSIKMFNTNDEGKEFTQGYFLRGQSFGEPPLLIDERYPASAIAFQNSEIIRIPKLKFFTILDEHSQIQKDFLILMARRIHNKATTSKDIINQKADFRIKAFLNSYKKKNERELIPFTRQEIANFTGLRVETVIRTIKEMAKKQQLDVIEHKIYY
ncbi:MAG: Crp/Fnr family transcriptional regulator [Flavobacteriaceae bacterium]